MRKHSLLAAAALLLSTSALALDLSWITQYKKPNLHYGQLQFHPYYRFAESYDTNIYLVPKPQNGISVGGGVRSSWITTNALGLNTVLPFSNGSRLSAGYEAEHNLYTTDPSINNSFNQTAFVDYLHKGGRGLTYNVGDQYVNTQDQAFSQLIQRRQRYQNRAYAGVDYMQEGGRLAGGLDAEQTWHKYLDPVFAQLLNRYEQRFGGNVGYMVMPKTKAYVSYHRGIIHYSVVSPSGAPQKDSKSHSVGAGVTGQLTPKLQGQVEAGMTYREYDVAAFAGGPRTETNGTVSTTLTYKPQQYTTAILTASRGLQESINQNNPFYISNNVTLDVGHKFPYKWSAGFNLAWGLDQYTADQTFGATTGRRRDDIYQGGVWLVYDIQEWLTTGLSTVYRERNSTFTGQFNYEDQVTTWNLGVKF